MAEAGMHSSSATIWLSRPRSLMAGVALIMSGVIISLMVNQYFTTTGMDDALIRSRLWWEVVLNLQILSAGMIWFSYAERISRAEGRRKVRYIFHCAFAVFSVLLPTIFGAIAVVNNWFEVRPGPTVYRTFFALGFLHCLSGMVLQYLAKRKKHKGLKELIRVFPVASLSPIVILLAFGVVDGARGGVWWLIATPFFLYLQGAVPFLRRAFRYRRER